MAKISGGSRKHGRAKVKCAKYRSEGRREKHKDAHCRKSNGKSYRECLRESRLANGLPV